MIFDSRLTIKTRPCSLHQAATAQICILYQISYVKTQPTRDTADIRKQFETVFPRGIIFSNRFHGNMVEDTIGHWSTRRRRDAPPRRQFVGFHR